jgi:hypothetical protein
MEPTAGAGGMVIAMAQPLRDAGINYKQAMHAICIDINAAGEQVSASPPTDTGYRHARSAQGREGEGGVRATIAVLTGGGTLLHFSRDFRVQAKMNYRYRTCL